MEAEAVAQRIVGHVDERQIADAVFEIERIKIGARRHLAPAPARFPILVQLP